MSDLLEVYYVIVACNYGILFEVGKSPVIVLNENITVCPFVSWITRGSARSRLYLLVLKGTEDSILFIQVGVVSSSLCHSAVLVREVDFDKAPQLCLSIFFNFTIFRLIGQKVQCHLHIECMTFVFNHKIIQIVLRELVIN